MVNLGRAEKRGAARPPRPPRHRPSRPRRRRPHILLPPASLRVPRSPPPPSRRAAALAALGVAASLACLPRRTRVPLTASASSLRSPLLLPPSPPLLALLLLPRLQPPPSRSSRRQSSKRRKRQRLQLLWRVRTRRCLPGRRASGQRCGGLGQRPGLHLHQHTPACRARCAAATAAHTCPSHRRACSPPRGVTGRGSAGSSGG